MQKFNYNEFLINGYNLQTVIKKRYLNDTYNVESK